MEKKRIDVLLVEQGFFDSREKAKRAAVYRQYFPLCTGRLGDFRTDGPHALGGRLPADAG